MSFSHFHAVRFYDNEASLGRIVATFLREGLMLAQPALIIATPEHGQGILAELRAREMDVAALQDSATLVVLDAQKTMDSFMVNGAPDGDGRARHAAHRRPDGHSRVRRNGRRALEAGPRRRRHQARDALEQARAVA